MLDKKDKSLAREFRKSLIKCDVKVWNEDLPKLISMYYDDLKTFAKEINHESEGEAFEAVMTWAIQSYSLNGESIDWGEDEVLTNDSIPDSGLESTDVINNMAIIRFHIKDESRRENIFRFWNKYISANLHTNLDDVSKDFTPLFFTPVFKNKGNNKFNKLKWCGWEDKYCLHELIYGVKSVICKKDYLYVYFDTSVVPSMPKQGMSSDSVEPLLNLVYLLSSMEGVKKVWIKIRPASRQNLELYTCWPVAAVDWPWAVEVDLSTDSQWRNPSGSRT